MSYKDLAPHDRIAAVHIDFMRDPEFCLLAGTTQIGKVIIDPTMPTAATDGCDCYYGEKYITGLSREELRYEVAHENMHKAMRHCVDYQPVVEKHGKITNAAMDVVVDFAIEELNAGRTFAKRPAWLPPITTHLKYKDWSWLEVLRDMLKNPPPPPPPPPGGGQGKPGQPGDGPAGPDSRDEHMPGKPMPAEEQEALKQMLTDAMNQGQMLREKMRGDKAGGQRLNGMSERKTDWRTPLRKFITELCEGDEFSRFNPPNKRLQAMGVLLPSHFSESTGELIIACDTSGSMGGVYPLVFGEVARICQNVLPESVRVIWWDTVIAGVQKFTPKDYANIGKILKPAGGGGTTVSVVADYIKAEKLKPKAVIMISDGYVEPSYRVPDCPMLWGIVDNTRFVPRKGKALHLKSMEM